MDDEKIEVKETEEVENTEVTEGDKKKTGVLRALLTVIQGALIGLGAVLPGISGGVLCVVFGVYKPIMQFLSHPFTAFKKFYKMLIPLIIGGALGFLGVSKLLSFLLTNYESQSVCVFVGLIAGMLPSLFREAGLKGRTKGSWVSFGICFAVILALLLTLNVVVNVTITPSIPWYLFCGFCIALSVILPGMSFSTLLMPLGLYTPLVTGIGNFDFSVIIPAGIGAVVTVILLAKAVTKLLEKYYSYVFHGIVGIVIAATIVIVPFSSFAESVSSCITNIICLVGGIVVALLLDKFNSKIDVPEE